MWLVPLWVFMLEMDALEEGAALPVGLSHFWLASGQVLDV
jgi:hypothetical protein